MASTHIYIYFPNVNTDDECVNTLQLVWNKYVKRKKYIETKGVNNSHNDDNQYIATTKKLSHPMQGKIISCNLASGEITMESFEYVHDQSSVIDNKDVGQREDNIINNIYKFKSLSTLKYNCTFLEIPYDKQEIICRVDKNTPMAFSLSNYEKSNGNYFDMIILPTNIKDPSPLYWSFVKLFRSDFPFEHSGDEYCISDKLMLQYMKIKKDNRMFAHNEEYTGVLAFQGYNRKSFMKLEMCNPSICLVDSAKGKKNIYIAHFPIIKDFVLDYSIAYIAYFIYYPTKNEIRWYIPKIPMFSKEKFNVGNTYDKYYKSGLKEFNDKYKHLSIQKVNNDSEEYLLHTIYDNYLVDDKMEEENHLKEDDDDFIFIVQEPLLNNYKYFITKLNEKLKNSEKKFTFHQSIERFPDVLSCYVSSHNESDCMYSLPLATCSVLYNSNLLKLAIPPSNVETVNRMKKLLLTQNEAIIVISDINPTSSSSIPFIKYKINATFIIIASQLTSTKNQQIQSLLNNVNISTVLTIGGPLSTIIIYIPWQDKLYYYKGTWNMKFGSCVTLDNIFLKTNVIPHSSEIPLYFRNLNPIKIYSPLGDVITNWDDGLDCSKYLLDDIYKYIEKFKTKKEKIGILQYTSNQLEFILNSSNYKYLIQILSTDPGILASMSQFILTKKKCIEMIAKYLDFKQETFVIERIRNYNEETDGYEECDAASIVSYFYDIFQVKSGFEVNQQQTKLITKFIKDYKDFIKFHCNDWKLISECFYNLIPLKDSYGRRNRANKKSNSEKYMMVMNNVKKLTVEDDDINNWADCFSNKCQKQGLLIFKINDNDYLRKVINYYKSNFLETQLAISYDDICIRNGRELFSMSDWFRVIDMHGDYGTCILSNNFIIRGKSETIIAIPILDNILEIMENVKIMREYPWTQVQDCDILSVVRIKLRESIHSLLPKDLRSMYDCGSGLVTKLLLYFLSSAIYYSISLCGNTNRDDILCGNFQRIRGLLGLMFSVMASGIETEYSQAYKVALFEDNEKFKIKFEKEKLFLSTIIDAWPYTKHENEVNVKENIKNYLKRNIVEPLIKETRNLIMKKRIGDTINDPNVRRKMKEEWLKIVALPLVMEILKKREVSITTDKENEFDKKLPDDQQLKEIRERIEDTFIPHIFKVQHNRSLKNIVVNNSLIDSEREDEMVHYHLEEILEVFKNINKINISGIKWEIYQIYNEKSHLYKEIEKLSERGIQNINNEIKRKIYMRLESIAMDYFIRHSNLLKLEWEFMVLNKHDESLNISFQNENKRKCQENFKRMKLEKLKILENKIENNSVVILPDLIKFRGKYFNSLKYYKYMRDIIFAKAMKYINPHFNYSHFPCRLLLVNLWNCSTIQDFIKVCSTYKYFFKGKISFTDYNEIENKDMFDSEICIEKEISDSVFSNNKMISIINWSSKYNFKYN